MKSPKINPDSEDKAYLLGIAANLPEVRLSEKPIRKRFSGESYIRFLEESKMSQVEIDKKNIDPQKTYEYDSNEYPKVNHYKKLLKIIQKEGIQGVNKYVNNLIKPS